MSVSLFDVLARRCAGGAEGEIAAAPADLVALAEKHVGARLADFTRVREYEEQFAWAAPPREPADDLEVMRTVPRLSADGADEAEQVLARVGSLGGRRLGRGGYVA